MLLSVTHAGLFLVACMGRTNNPRQVGLVLRNIFIGRQMGWASEERKGSEEVGNGALAETHTHTHSSPHQLLNFLLTDHSQTLRT